MSYVDMVKQKHKFDQSARELFRHLVVMTKEEIELAMAHIADDIANGLDKTKEDNAKVKGVVIQAYLRMRLSNHFPDKRNKRNSFKHEMNGYFEARALAAYWADMNKREGEIGLLKARHEVEILEYKKRYALWQEERRKVSIIARMFYEKPSPIYPAAVAFVPFPEDKSVYLARQKKLATLERYFIAFVRGFQLLPCLDFFPDISNEEISALLNEI